jgi:hypothetical protein
VVARPRNKARTSPDGVDGFGTHYRLIGDYPANIEGGDDSVVANGSIWNRHDLDLVDNDHFPTLSELLQLSQRKDNVVGGATDLEDAAWEAEQPLEKLPNPSTQRNQIWKAMLAIARVGAQNSISTKLSNF